MRICSGYILNAYGTPGGMIRVCSCHFGEPARPPSTVGKIKKDYFKKPSQNGVSVRMRIEMSKMRREESEGERASALVS